MPSRTILLVEDDPNDEHLTLRALRLSGIPNTVVVAHTGMEALAFLKKTGPFIGRSSPDPLAIFLDNTLPGIAGADLVAAIRQIPDYSLVPVIVFSGSSDGNVIDKCSRAGANSFLEKPVDMSEFTTQMTAAAKYWLTLNLLPSAPARKAMVL
jgi:CheY-like chemotaxis protein